MLLLAKNLSSLPVSFLTSGVVKMLCSILYLIFIKKQNASNKYDPNESNLTLKFSVYDSENVPKISEEIQFSDGESLFNILSRTYDIEYRQDPTSKVILSIEDMKTDFTSCYFAIYIGEEYSALGVEAIKPTDGMEISLKWTTIK